MSANIIDITGPREDRQFQQKENRLKMLKDAFRASRLEAKAAKKGASNTSSRKKKHKSSSK